MAEREPIYFHTAEGEHGFLSNFSPHGFELDGRYWKTVEHWFQAQKFTGTDREERIRLARTPRDVNRLGRDRSFPIREDWEDVKLDVMRRGVRAKFEADQDLRTWLVGTYGHELVESPGDGFWGAGQDGSGLNHLGRLLMELREEFHALNPRGPCYCDLWDSKPASLVERGIPQGYCGHCGDCGRPGHVRHHPHGVPMTAAWCDACFDALCEQGH